MKEKIYILGLSAFKKTKILILKFCSNIKTVNFNWGHAWYQSLLFIKIDF
jgi:hypothetical protein